MEKELIVGTEILISAGLITFGIIGLRYLKKKLDIAWYGDPAEIESVGPR